MTPFQVYLLLQMDSLNTALGIILLMLSLLLVVLTFHACMEGWDYYEGKSIYKKCAWAFLVTLPLATLCPSTKTVAAMIVLPRVTSPQALDAMGKEGQELYALAKKALENLADDKKKEDGK